MTLQHRAWVRNFVDYSPLVVFLIAYFATGRNIADATWGLVAGSAVFRGGKYAENIAAIRRACAS